MESKSHAENTRAASGRVYVGAHAWRAGAAERHPEARHRKVHARERARSDPLRGSSRAARGRRPLVSRRPRARSARPHGVRALVRAHDVPGLEAHRERRALQAACRRRRDRCERHDRFRSDQLLRDDAIESARARALARIRSHGIPARDGRSGQADQPAGRRAERAAAEHREQTVRHRRGGTVPGVVSERAPVPRRHHRIARRYSGREARRRQRLFPAVLRAEQRDDCDRGRYRQGRDQEARREIFRHAEARTGRSAGEGADAGHYRRETGRGRRSRRAAAHLHRLDYAGVLQGGRR